MSAIIRLIKKTPLKFLWIKFKNSRLGKKLRKERNEKQLNRLLNEEMPAAYNSKVMNPIQENKVIIVEPRYDSLSNNFQLIYQELTEHYQFDVHVHYLRESFVPKAESEKNCKKMLEDMATAKYVFMNEANRIISCVKMRPETVVTQLWHGCGAFKKFGKSTADLIFGASRESMELHPFNRNYTHVTVSSPEVVWAYAEAMDLIDQKDIIKPIGVSRTDVYFKENIKRAAQKKLEQLMPAAKGKKVLVYAPTFRGRVAKATTPDCLSVEMFAKTFAEEYVLLMKHHPVVKVLPEIPAEYENTFAMDMTHKMSIEELLFVSDFCISDYSSLIFEYSLLERPMIFFAYDLEEYFDWRGFYYDYDELTPGPICKTNEEMIDYIRHVEERFDRQAVIDFKNKFMSACDGHATERIMQLVFGEALERYRNPEESKMKQDCKVSVIVPAHNAGKHLRECLDSILAQTLGEIEIICVNDGSVDDTEAIIREYMELDKRVDIINQDHKYAGTARNAGMKKSCGTYLVFWDADDIFAGNALEEMYLKMEADQADVCVCDAVRFRDGSDQLMTDVQYLKERFLPEKVPFSIKDIPQYIFNFTTDVPWNKMFRRVFVEQHELTFEERVRANDHYFVLQALALADMITLVKKHLIQYRINSGINLSANLSDSPLCTYEALLHAKETLEERGVFQDPKVRQSFANRVLSSLIYGFEKQTGEVAYREIFQTLKNGGFEKLFVTDQGQEYFYIVGGYRKYQEMMQKEPIDYLVSEYTLLSDDHSFSNYRYKQLKERYTDLRDQNKQLKVECSELKKENSKLTRELKYIHSRKWYRFFVFLARSKNKIIGK